MLAVAIRFVVATAVWGAAGLALDQLLPTAPWLQFTGVMVGSLIGLVLAQRSATVPALAGESGGEPGSHAPTPRRDDAAESLT
jgi:F0F1-type ATP synthase assembly protein I